jgi:alpha-galactosidase
MGWANWNRYFCDYDDTTIRKQADGLVSSGMRDLGYRYVIIQECIAASRDSLGNLIVDAKRFPYGIKALADYLHSLRLKVGIYTDIGAHTCGGYVGSYGHENQDAAMFASWGIDLIEMDYCDKPPGVTGEEIYKRMATAIKKTGRPMLFYLCSWGNERPWEWAQGTAQVWRTDWDISQSKNHADWEHVVLNFESNAQHAVFTGPNSWNDPDMLEVGNVGLTPIEARTHFSMWAISAAPLWAGTDLTSMSAETRSILTNAEAIAIDQDLLGSGPVKVSGQVDGAQVWMKPLKSKTSGVQAVLFLNLGSEPADVSVRWTDLGLKPQVRVRDLWLHRDLGTFAESYTALIPPHGSRLLKISGQFDWTKGAVFEAEWPGNLRHGGVRLLECGECSQGFAVSMGGLNQTDSPRPDLEVEGHPGGSLTFRQLMVPLSGPYQLELTYVRYGLAFQKIDVQVDEESSFQVRVAPRAWGWVKIPVLLHAGDNTVTVSYFGNDEFNLDKMRLVR